MEHVVENLTIELSESKNLVAALRLENEDLFKKNEEYKREIKQWEVMYKEWMSMMEDRVTNINRTHQILQALFFRAFNNKICFAMSFFVFSNKASLFFVYFTFSAMYSAK